MTSSVAVSGADHGCFFDRLVGQQLAEADRDPVTVPDRLRREPDGDPAGDRAQDQGLAVIQRKRPVLTGTESTLEAFLDVVQKRRLYGQPNKEPVLFPMPGPPQLLASLVQRVTGRAECLVQVPTRPQTDANDFAGDELAHARRKILEPISDLVPACVRYQNARMIENHLSHVRYFGSSSLARFSSC